MLDQKYIPLFLGGFLAWMAFVIGVGFFGRHRARGHGMRGGLAPFKTLDRYGR